MKKAKTQPKAAKVIDLAIQPTAIDYGIEGGSDESFVITEDIHYRRECSLWLKIPGIDLCSMPKNWKMSMEFENGETVEILNVNKNAKCLSMFLELNKIFDAYCDILNYANHDGVMANQLEPKEYAWQPREHSKIPGRED